MSTKWRQNASSALAITAVAALLLMLVLLWTAVRNGSFSDPHIRDVVTNRPLKLSVQTYQPGKGDKSNTADGKLFVFLI